MSEPDLDGRPRLDPDELGQPGGLRGLSWPTLGFLASVAATAAAFVYDHQFVPGSDPLVGEWRVTPLDWLTVLSLAVLVFYLVVPLARDRRLTRYYWRRLRGHPLAVASLAYLVVFFVLGIVGPVLVSQPEHELLARHQPPYGVAIPENLVVECVGRVSDGMCHGSLAHPLGTTGFNTDVLAFTIEGMQVALQVSLVTAMLVVPIATAVGTLAAQLGGWVDEVLMRYVDIQQTIPPFFVYIVAQFLVGPSLLLIVGIFGLLNWGGTARLVRSEALAKREAEYVLAARSAGSSSLRTVRKHIVPNVSNTVLTAVTLQMPALIVIEATLSYLGIGPDGVGSWGNIVFHGMESFPIYWWVAVFPVLAILVTVVAFYVLGDALRDTLDPRLREAT